MNLPWAKTRSKAEVGILDLDRVSNQVTMNLLVLVVIPLQVSSSKLIKQDSSARAAQTWSVDVARRPGQAAWRVRSV